MRVYFLLTLFLFPVLATAHAQSYSRPQPWSVGGYVCLGLQAGNPDHSIAAEAATAGVFVLALRGRFHPGIEARGASADGIRGVLAGPRFSWDFRNANIYVAGLFGPQHYQTSSSTVSGQLVTQDVQGLTSEGVIGVDLFSPRHRHVGMRMEYSQGVFTGLAGSNLRAGLVGVVLRFP